MDVRAVGRQYGLATTYEQRQLPGQTARSTDTYNWTQDAAGNWYVGGTVNTLERNTANQIQKQTTQQLDAYGNLLTMSAYDYTTGSFGTPSRTYTNSYLGGTNYTSRYVFNVTFGGSRRAS